MGSDLHMMIEIEVVILDRKDVRRVMEVVHSKRLRDRKFENMIRTIIGIGRKDDLLVGTVDV